MLNERSLHQHGTEDNEEELMDTGGRTYINSNCTLMKVLCPMPAHLYYRYVYICCCVAPVGCSILQSVWASALSSVSSTVAPILHFHRAGLI